jgi:hypothetical protein
LRQQGGEIVFGVAVSQDAKEMCLGPSQVVPVPTFSGESCGESELCTGVLNPSFAFSKKT